MSVSHPGKRIKITIKSATNLPKRHLVLPPNPYVVLTIDEQTHKTAVLKRTGKPVWNATFEITIKESSIITIRILDKRKSAPDPLLGVASIGARRISSFKSERDGHTELTLGLKRQSDSSVTHDVPLASDDQSVMGPSLATDSSITIWTTDLPMGWEKQRAPDGRTYYVDHNTRSTTWYPPHLHSLDSGRQGLMTQKPESTNENTDNHPIILGPFQGAHNFTLNNPIFRIVHCKAPDGYTLDAARSDANLAEDELGDRFHGAYNFVLNNPLIECTHYIIDTDSEAGVVHSPSLPKKEVSEHSSHLEHRFSRDNIVIRHSIYSTTSAPSNPATPEIWAPFYNARNVTINGCALCTVCAEPDGAEPDDANCCAIDSNWAGILICAPFYNSQGVSFHDLRTFLSCRNPSHEDCSQCRGFFSTTGLFVTGKLNYWSSTPSVQHYDARLAPYMLTDGELHSKSREPFPLCSGRTRMVSKNEIYHWLYSVDRQYNMLWLSGPAGVGKSAVAQDIGEFMLSSGFIGAAVFLSRSRRVHDSERLIVSIAGQLASKIRSYNQALMLVLEENPTVFGKGKKILFEKLLVEPFSTLKHWPKYRTYLIIIDGLDECRGKMEQVDIIRLIAENLNSRAPLPLLWMICSRPEHHLREVFTSHDLSGLYWEHDLSLDNPDFRSDIEIYVAGELTRWRAHNSHNPSHSPETPFTEGGEVKQITDLASGFFVFASIMMRSMHNSTIADPISHLSTILNSMHRLLDSFPKNDPLGPLHALYLTVLDNLEAEHLPRSLTLLGSCAVYPPIPALHFANLLGIGSEYFYASLQPLHPVLFIPRLPIAWKDSLRFLHVTFPDFLTNSNHSGLYALDLDAQRSHLIDACFHVLNDTRTTYAKNISWRPPEDATSPSALSVSDDIFTFIANHTWDVFAETSSPSLGVLRDTVISFDFSRLRQVSGKIPVRPFIRFISWFCKVQEKEADLKDFVRTRAQSEIDGKFLEKCGPLFEPLNLESKNYGDNPDGSAQYFLIGFGLRTAIALVVPEAVMIYGVGDINKM